MSEPVAVLLLAAVLACLLVLLWRAWRPVDDRAERELERRLAGQIERVERELRDELGRQGQGTRGDLATFQQMLLTQGGDVARTQNEQLDGFRVQLAAMQQGTESALRRFSDTLEERLARLSEANERRLAEVRVAVDTKLQRAEQLTRRYRVQGVPLMIVAGKYTADAGTAGGEQPLLALINDLANAERRR